MSMSKQEVTVGLANLELSRKRKMEETKKANEQERLKLIKQDNEERSRIIQQKMKEMKVYVEELKHQLREKEERLRKNKQEDIMFKETIAKSLEELQMETEVMVACKSCHRNYPQSCISPVPKGT
jgi:restriction endonuclease S subunit